MSKHGCSSLNFKIINGLSEIVSNGTLATLYDNVSEYHSARVSPKPKRHLPLWQLCKNKKKILLLVHYSNGLKRGNSLTLSTLLNAALISAIPQDMQEICRKKNCVHGNCSMLQLLPSARIVVEKRRNSTQ